jgi:hypothetical protein
VKLHMLVNSCDEETSDQQLVLLLTEFTRPYYEDGRIGLFRVAVKSNHLQDTQTSQSGGFFVTGEIISPEGLQT